MNGFAGQVCNMLAGNWTGLALDFMKCGIVPKEGKP
jgi:hypothetical protein